MGCRKCCFAAVLKVRENQSAVARVVGRKSRNKQGSVQHGDFPWIIQLGPHTLINLHPFGQLRWLFPVFNWICFTRNQSFTWGSVCPQLVCACFSEPHACIRVHTSFSCMNVHEKKNTQFCKWDSQTQKVKGAFSVRRTDREFSWVCHVLCVFIVQWTSSRKCHHFQIHTLCSLQT